MTTSSTTLAAPPKLGRWRRISIWTLIVLASVIALVSTLTIWVDRQMFDNNSWRKASEDVITNPEIRSSLSVYLVNQLYDNVDVAAAIENRLPEGAKSLAGTLAGALHQPATNAVNQLLARPRVVNFFVNASATAHEKLVNVLQNKTGFGIATGNGVVTIDLHELVTELGQELGLSDEALAKLPAQAGVITLMSSENLGTFQKIAKVIHALSALLLIAVLFMYALAIFLAKGHRRETLRNVGWSFAIVGLLVLLVRRFVGNHAVDALASPEYRGSVRDLWLIGSSILHQIGIATVVYGLLAVAGAVLAGPTRWATSLRRHIAPTLNESQGVAWGALAGVMLLLVVWGPTHALRTWWGVLLIAALFAGGLIALRHQTLREFSSESPEEDAAATASTEPPQAPASPAGG